MATLYSHDNEIITIKNCIESFASMSTQKIRLPKGLWQKKLETVNKKINKKWNMNDETKWILSVNNKLIAPNDVDEFEKVLSQTPSPITINIIAVQLCLISVFILESFIFV